MSGTPERIWAVTEPDDISADILGEVYAQQVPDGMTGTPVEYVRADRIEELEAKLAKAVEAVKFYHSAVNLRINCEITHAMQEAHDHAEAFLAELKGEK